MTEEPSPKKAFEERLADAFFNFMVLGTGSYALYNLYVENVPKAAIATMISVGFGLAKSFGQGLMATLTDRMKQRGETTGKVIDRAIDSGVGQAIPKLTGFQAQYLEALKTHCYNLNVEGYKGRLPRLSLEDVYVPLRVSVEAQQNTAQSSGSRPIWSLLPKQQDPDRSFPYRLMAIVADPGYGKTTLMRFLTLSFANQSYIDHQAKALIPVLLLFREVYTRIQSPNEPLLPQLIVEQVQKLPRCSELQTSGAWFQAQLQQGKCLVMLDGLDEVPESQRELVSRWANWQMQNYPTQFILTSRPHGFDSSLFADVQRIDILDFNNEQKRTFIEQWYRFITWEQIWNLHWQESQYQPDPQKRLSREQAEAESQTEAQTAADHLCRRLFADRNLTDLAKNPLLITIIAATHQASDNLPSQRIQLYREIFKLLLEYRPNRRDTRLTITNAEENQLILQNLALSLMEAGKTQFSPQQGVAWIEDRFAEIYKGEALTPKAFLQEIQQVSGLLMGGEGDLYEFTHKTFQEYLAAQELSADPAGFNKILEKFGDSNWEEVVYFFAIPNPTPLIETALNNPTNLYTLELARRLSNDSPQVDEALCEELLDALQQQPTFSKLLSEQEFKTMILLAKVRLEQRFRTLKRLSKTTAISDCITWGEYQLFLIHQREQQFHSWAKEQPIFLDQGTDLVTGILWEDASWFCAWLSTQSSLPSPDNGVYDYRLPSLEEHVHLSSSSYSPLHSPLLSWTTDPSQPGNVLRVVRQQISARYAKLVNYLANGQWKEADQETERVILEAVGQEAVERMCLTTEELCTFPHEDLSIIDHLWVKFSGGKFGFSVQKQIWIEVGGKLDFGEDRQAAEKTYVKMSEINGWKIKDNYTMYDQDDQAIFSISSLKGNLPRIVFLRPWFWPGVYLLSHPCL